MSLVWLKTRGEANSAGVRVEKWECFTENVKNWRKEKKACMYVDLHVSKRQIKGVSWSECVQEEKAEGMQMLSSHRCVRGIAELF